MRQNPHEEDRHGATHDAALSRRSRRQPAAPAAAFGCAREEKAQRDHRRRADARRGRCHPRGGQAAGGCRARSHHRRRVPPHLLASRFPRAVPECDRHAAAHKGALPHARGRHRVRAARHPHRRQARAHASDLRRSFQVRAGGDEEDGEADHPVAEQHAFPRRARRHRPEGLSRHGRVLCRSRPRLQRGGEGSGRGRMPLSADRRGELRLSVRPEVARAGEDHRRGPGDACRTPTPSSSTIRSRRSPRTWSSRCISAAAISRARGSPKAATSRSPTRSSTRSASTAISSNTTIRARAISGRCASCPRARSSSSASSRRSCRSSRRRTP